ncbi:Disease resistance protein [Vitis vinifera]|uniref:Disease resistance protein n=1 Tax=Vitis vinifera TaxID=29760 RepID=A0A438FZ59_VITVI|nr:Disease resistance protein [Vitis vinifera]
MVDIVISVAAKVAECLVDPIARQLGYLFNYRRNYVDLTEQIEMLDHARVRLQQSVEEANRQGDEIFPDVQEWLKVPLPAKQASKEAGWDIVLKIQQAHNFGLEKRNMRMIGVWGMGGVGKTTLVKQVAQQAEENKLFHKVVMALNISQTPNIAEIQGKIARMLGLKFEAEEDRAGRLRQRLKREEKILVILDDIWGKLDLRDIGIPDGDDHKGCKVLLTSREQEVLSEDMRTQKKFHLQHLSEDEAWNLFKKTAGDSVEKPELRPIAVDVAKKCDGLPVAIFTIATALRGKSRVNVWENALEELRGAAPTSIRGVTEGVYSCLELSYNHLKGDGDSSSSLLFDHAFVRMHDVVRDAARSIASKDPHRFVVREAVGSQEAVELREWQRTDECRNCTRISLICRNMDELPQGLIQEHNSNRRTEETQVLSLAESYIEQLPNEVAQLSDLRMLDFAELLLGSKYKYQIPVCFQKIDVLFENLNLIRYSILIGYDWQILNDEYKASRRLSLRGVTSLYMVKCFSKLLKRSQVLDLWELNDTKHVVYELDKEGFVELKYLTLEECPTVQYILHSSTSVEWVPPPNTFCMLEELILWPR